MAEKHEWFGSIECFLMDMDGTIYLGNRLLPGARAWLELLDDLGKSYFFLTNNSSRSKVEYAEKFNKLGLAVDADKIFTSGEATAIYLNKHYPTASLYVVGTLALEQEFQRHGFKLTEEDPDVVVLGFDTTLTYEKLRKLCDLAVAGKPYIATHPDINCPTETGFMPDIGAMIELVFTSTGRRPDVIIGKPNKPVVDALIEKTGFSAGQHCMIGDRFYTDIALGQWGIRTVLVLSGEASAADLPNAAHQPDLVVQGISDMVRYLSKN